MVLELPRTAPVDADVPVPAAVTEMRWRSWPRRHEPPIWTLAPAGQAPPVRTPRLLSDAYDVSSASDGAAGPALAKSGKPTVFVCDIMMPQMSGERRTRFE